MTFSQQDESQEVNALLLKYHDKRANNAPPLGINLLEAQKIQNNGFPYWMYHQSFLPVHVVNQNQSDALSARGYVRNYIKHKYPRTLYRRNMEQIRQRIPDSKEFEMVPKFADYVETMAANSPLEEADLTTKKAAYNCSAWFSDAAELPEIEDGPHEDPRVTIARLQGLLDGKEAERTGEAVLTPAEKRKATLAAKKAAEDED